MFSNPDRRRSHRRAVPSDFLLAALAIPFLLMAGLSHAGPVTITDDAGRAVHLNAPPQRVVSLVPSVTEMIAAIGADDALVGITYHDTRPAALSRKTIVGGFGAPSIAIIEALQPDVIFYTGLHHPVVEYFQDRPVALIRWDTRSVDHGFETLRQIGRIFNRSQAAELIVNRNRAELDLIRRKVEALSAGKRKRVMRIMGRHKVMTPGADSFQNEIIRLAGGIPPDFVAPGPVVPVESKDWTAFNPHVLYGCGGDRQLLDGRLATLPWQGVAALHTQSVYFFPCELTCRTATRTGYFVSWLAARIYADAFSDPAHQVFPDAVVAAKPMDLQLANVRTIRIVHSRIRDFTHKTLQLDLERPMHVISSLEGPLEDIAVVGNHYLPPPSWYLDHGAGVKALKDQVCRVLNTPDAKTALLFTGADMDHLAIAQVRHRQMQVTALVTAGVESNAVCMSRDSGAYYEPGTINILLHVNMDMSPRAMTRAIISATEAKSCALADLDIRSAYQPLHYTATGTGTDNIIVIPSPGTFIDNAGGHTKMGELIARAVYQAVREAIAKQNSLTAERSVFKRLQERGIDLDDVWPPKGGDCGVAEGTTRSTLDHLLLDSRYAGFLETAFALSDACQKGLVKDWADFGDSGRAVAERIAGGTIPDWRVWHPEGQALPEPLRLALEAFINGLIRRQAISELPPDPVPPDNSAVPSAFGSPL